MTMDLRKYMRLHDEELEWRHGPGHASRSRGNASRVNRIHSIRQMQEARVPAGCRTNGREASYDLPWQIDRKRSQPPRTPARGSGQGAPHQWFPSGSPCRDNSDSYRENPGEDAHEFPRTKPSGKARRPGRKQSRPRGQIAGATELCAVSISRRAICNQREWGDNLIRGVASMKGKDRPPTFPCGMGVRVLDCR